MDAKENGQSGPAGEKDELQQPPEPNGAVDREAVDGLRDPDFGLSEEERARIVCCIFPCIDAADGREQDKRLVWKLDLKLIPWVSWPWREKCFIGTKSTSCRFSISSRSSIEQTSEM